MHRLRTSCNRGLNRVSLRRRLGHKLQMKSRSVANHLTRGGFEGHLRTVLEHNLANLAGIRNRTGLGTLQVPASQGFQQAPVDLDPEIALQVVMSLVYVKHARQHEALHQFDQPTIARRASHDQMEIAISLDLPAICLKPFIRSLFCFLNDLLELSKIIFGEVAEARLNSEKIQSIDQGKNFGMILVCPGADVETARRTALHNSKLLKAVKSIADRCAAYLESASEVFFTQALVGDEFARFYSIENLENNPIGECTIDGFRRKSRGFVEQA